MKNEVHVSWVFLHLCKDQVYLHFSENSTVTFSYNQGLPMKLKLLDTTYYYNSLYMTSFVIVFSNCFGLCEQTMSFSQLNILRWTRYLAQARCDILFIMYSLRHRSILNSDSRQQCVSLKCTLFAPRECIESTQKCYCVMSLQTIYTRCKETQSL